MSENKRNVELLQRVKAHILAEPRRYSQITFGLNDKLVPEYFKEMDEPPPCGVVACLAGWAVELSEGSMFTDGGFQKEHIFHKAKDAVGFTDIEAGRVFSDGSRWPEPFAAELDAADSKAEQVEVAARFIDYLCEGGVV